MEVWGRKDQLVEDIEVAEMMLMVAAEEILEAAVHKMRNTL